MKKLCISICAITLVLTGCAKQDAETQAGNQSSGGAQSVENRSAMTSTAPVTTASTASEPSDRVSPEGQIEVLGMRFENPEYGKPNVEAGGKQILQHYGALTAKDVKIAKAAHRVTIRLQPRPVDDSFPVVSVVFERRAGGRYVRKDLLTEEVIKDGNDIVRNVPLDPGTYDIGLQFYKSSGRGRAHLEIKSITIE